MRALIILVSVILILHSLESFSTHLRAADIIVEQQCNSLRYKITVKVYLNTLSGTPFGGFITTDGSINFGDGSPLEIILPGNVVGPVLRPDLGSDISVASYTTFHTYSRQGSYKVTYFERDRSEGILNIANSLDVAYATFVMINARTGFCNQLPLLQVAPVDRGCRGVVFYHSAGATDADGDSLSYELTTPSKDSLSFVDGFISPDNRKFYFDFDHGNEAGTGRPSLQVDPVTGLITWDAPGVQGEYNIAFRIIEWRFDSSTGNYFVISTTVRDMQIIIEDCLNGRPTLTGPPDICIEAGKTLQGIFVGKDPENDPIKIEVFSSIFEGGPETSPATYDPVSTDFRPSNPPAELKIEWKTNCRHVRDQAYQVVVKITDSPPTGPKLVTFKTWSIKVIAPAPIWKSIQPDLVNRTAMLEWENYGCANVEKIQLWRKVGSFPFLPGQCVAGLSVHKGYILINDFDPSVTSFTDTNNGKKLSVGAQYCYRLVAIFSLPGGGKSYVSVEACVGPILADAPVLTNVSVINTDKEIGEVQVKWLKPFDISAEQYPEPYEYEVYRSRGFGQTPEPLNVSGRISDVTEFMDKEINTQDSIYNYQVVLYSRTQNNSQYNAIDTSSVGSTVRLLLEPGEQKMTLRWSAEVPWSNVATEHPYHRIYRGVYGDGKSDFELIDSVEVSEFGLEYADVGNFMNQPIQQNIFYCYYVQTIGSYGNPKISLLFNDSEIQCSYPVNNLPPCTPLLQVAKTDCNAFISSATCDISSFENEISWTIPDVPGCRRDIAAFNLYYSDMEGGAMTLLKTFTGETRFTDPVPMLARCYRISATDAKGIESELSEEICNENCPYFELPNVFTPNSDGCNDLFGIYLPTDDPDSDCPVLDPSKCPRFVKSVSIKILNRWGRLVHDYHSDANYPISINWNGTDLNGSRLESGVYFYVANVEFYTADPGAANKMIKGWINLLR
jgi:gliding motility-associated-like protein